jgi:hypothetical protein
MAVAAVIAVGAIAANTGMQVHANNKKRKADATAADKEAIFLDSQARATERANERALELLEIEKNEVFGDQVTSIAANNIDLSGSALEQVIRDQLQFGEEADAIRSEGDFNTSIARMRALETRLGAERIRGSAGLETATTILGGVGSAGSIGADFFGPGTGKQTNAKNKKS